MIKNGASHGDPSAQLSNADYPKRGQRRSGCMEKKKKKEDKKDPPGEEVNSGEKSEWGPRLQPGSRRYRSSPWKIPFAWKRGGSSARIGIPYCGSRCTSFRSRGRKYRRLARLQATDLLAANIGEPKNKESPRSGEGNARSFFEKIRRGLEGFWFLLFSLSLLSLSRLETGSRRLFVDS